MQVNKGLILAAGFGTRMGVIGEALPKPLWPVFDKTLLEIQISILRSLGIREIYINGHHKLEMIRNAVNRINGPELILLEEQEILDVGGAVHNLAQKLDDPYKGCLLCINSDVLWSLESEIVYKMHRELYSKELDCVLGVKQVAAASGYNKLIIDGEYVLGIDPYVKKKFKEYYYTFSGVSLINLEKLTPQPGSSKFFESVASLKHGNIGRVDLTHTDYLDFGSKESYVTSINLLAGDRQSSLRDKLKNMDCIDLNKLNKEGINYNCSGASRVFNFSGQKTQEVRGSDCIILKAGHDTIASNSLVYGDILDSVSPQLHFL